MDWIQPDAQHVQYLWEMGVELLQKQQNVAALQCFLACGKKELSMGMKAKCCILIAEIYLSCSHTQVQVEKEQSLVDLAQDYLELGEQCLAAVHQEFPEEVLNWQHRQLKCEYTIHIVKRAEPIILVTCLCKGLNLFYRKLDKEANNAHCLNINEYYDYYQNRILNALMDAYKLSEGRAARSDSVFARLIKQVQMITKETKDEAFYVLVMLMEAHVAFQSHFSLTSSWPATMKTFDELTQGLVTRYPLIIQYHRLRHYFLVIEMMRCSRFGDMSCFESYLNELKKMEAQIQRMGVDTDTKMKTDQWRWNWLSSTALVHVRQLFSCILQSFVDPKNFEASSTSAIENLHNVLHSNSSASQSSDDDTNVLLSIQCDLLECHVMEMLAQCRYAHIGSVLNSMGHIVSDRKSLGPEFKSKLVKLHLYIAKYLQAVGEYEECISHIELAHSYLSQIYSKEELLTTDLYLEVQVFILNVVVAPDIIGLIQQQTKQQKQKQSSPLPQQELTSMEKPCPLFPSSRLIEQFASLFMDESLQARVDVCTNLRIKFEYYCAFCQWKMLMPSKNHETLHPQSERILSMLRDCLEWSVASLRASAKIMAMMGPLLIATAQHPQQRREGEQTLIQAMQISAHTRDVTLQLEVMYQLTRAFQSSEDPGHRKSLDDIPLRWRKRLDTLHSRLDLALQDSYHGILLAWT